MNTNWVNSVVLVMIHKRIWLIATIRWERLTTLSQDFRKTNWDNPVIQARFWRCQWSFVENIADPIQQNVLRRNWGGRVFLACYSHSQQLFVLLKIATHYNALEKHLHWFCLSLVFMAKSIIFCVAKNCWFELRKCSRSWAEPIPSFRPESELVSSFSSQQLFVDQNCRVNNR